MVSFSEGDEVEGGKKEGNGENCFSGYRGRLTRDGADQVLVGAVLGDRTHNFCV